MKKVAGLCLNLNIIIKLRLSHYSLKVVSYADRFFRNCNLEVSNNSKDWTVINYHINDHNINIEQTKSHTLHFNCACNYYSHFRIKITASHIDNQRVYFFCFFFLPIFTIQYVKINYIIM